MRYPTRFQQKTLWNAITGIAILVLGALVVGLIWLLTVLNIYGPRLVCKVESFAIVIGLIPILLISTVGWWYFDAGTFLASWNVQQLPATKVVPDSLVLVFWAFTGLESASVAAAVMRASSASSITAPVTKMLRAASTRSPSRDGRATASPWCSVSAIGSARPVASIQPPRFAHAEPVAGSSTTAPCDVKKNRA